MAGMTVTRDQLDLKASQTLLSLRTALSDVRTISYFLAANPSNAEGGDPLTIPVEDGGMFGYTADEAYLLRFLFETLQGISDSNAALLSDSRKLTGLM